MMRMQYSNILNRVGIIWINNSIHLWRLPAAEEPEKVLDQLHLQNQPQNGERKPDTESHHKSCQKG